MTNTLFFSGTSILLLMGKRPTLRTKSGGNGCSFDAGSTTFFASFFVGLSLVLFICPCSSVLMCFNLEQEWRVYLLKKKNMVDSFTCVPINNYSIIVGWCIGKPHVCDKDRKIFSMYFPIYWSEYCMYFSTYWYGCRKDYYTGFVRLRILNL